ncbi:G2-specific serine/threonine protein kinase [Pseudocyphellaria aurata]|nr:G2-specific serine/threonine protein kinase [Pseudocyphellaria aurata]
MFGRKGTGPSMTKPKGARYEPYGRPLQSDISDSGRYQETGLTDVSTGLLGELFGDEKEHEPESSKSSSVMFPSAEATTPMKSEYSAEDSENIEQDVDPGYDACSPEVTKGVPNAEDLDMWTEPPTEIIWSNIGTSQHADGWIGTRPLGEAEFGLASLWERFDENGLSVDQMVVKQIGGGRSQDWDPAVPQEAMILNRLNDTLDWSGVIEIRGYKQYLKESVHRIFMEYCPKGDLRRLYRRQYFPEAFLWEVFYHLGEAAATMGTGFMGANGQLNEIVHRDIKPRNVFLANPDPAENTFYPVAKLGNWGLAIATGIADDRNPSQYKGAGNSNYMAPEQQDTHDEGRYSLGPFRRLSSCTNIWAIGATMYDLLTLHHVKKALYRDEMDDDGEGLAEIHTDREPEYTHRLRRLVRSCLRPNPRDRPSIRELQEAIRFSRSHFKLEGSRLGGEDQSAPHESERLYFSSKEIAERSDRWQPTDQDMTEGDESDYGDPRHSGMRFPEWGGGEKTDDEDADRGSSIDGERATRRILAGYTGDVAQGGTPAGGGEDEMEADSGSLGESLTSKLPKPPEYRLPTRNKRADWMR